MCSAAAAGNVLDRRSRRRCTAIVCLPAISSDAIKCLVLCAIERQPPRLENYPHLPMAEVARTWPVYVK
jgi:hypothetical protein